MPSSPPRERGRSRGAVTPGQRILSNPISLGSLSATGSETFALFHDDGAGTAAGNNVAVESSQPRRLWGETSSARLSCNVSFEDMAEENSSGGAPPVPEAEESVQSVTSKVGEGAGWRKN